MKTINTFNKQAEIWLSRIYAEDANYFCKSINSTLISLENVQKQQSHQKTLEVV